MSSKPNRTLVILQLSLRCLYCIVNKALTNGWNVSLNYARFSTLGNTGFCRFGHYCSYSSTGAVIDYCVTIFLDKFHVTWIGAYITVMSFIFGWYFDRSSCEEPSYDEGLDEIVKVNFIPKFKDENVKELYMQFLYWFSTKQSCWGLTAQAVQT